MKASWEIDDYNRKWLRKNPDYDISGDNCQMYALDLVQWLVPASFKLDLPLSQTNAWADSPNAIFTNGKDDLFLV